MTDVASWPVTTRARATPELLATAGRLWRLGEIHEITDLGGWLNLNLRLVCDAGTVVLRAQRPWVSDARVVFVQDLRRRLARHGVPVPVPLVTADGAPFVRFEGYPVEVEPWLPSDGPVDTFGRCELAAAELARLHDHLDAIGPEMEVARSPVLADLADDAFDAWLGRTRGAIGAAASPAPALLAACDQAASLRREIVALSSPSLLVPDQLSHGDYGHANVLVRGDTVTAILDFEFTGYRPRLADLADLGFTPQWVPAFAQDVLPPADRDWDAIGRIVAAFQRSASVPLTDVEIAAIPLAMAAIPVIWAAQSWLYDDPAAMVSQLVPELETSAWLVANRDALADRWLPEEGA